MTTLVGQDSGTIIGSDGNPNTGFQNATFSSPNYTGMTAVATGTATSVKITLSGAQTAGRKVQAAIYTSGVPTPVQLGKTTEYTTTGSETDPQTITLPLVASVSITSGTDYILVAWMDNFVNIGYQAAGGSTTAGITYVSNDWSTYVFGSGSTGHGLLLIWADGTTGGIVLMGQICT